MIDAEQSYFQAAINYFDTELQRYYNKNGEVFVYGTYQCYLKVIDLVTELFPFTIILKINRRHLIL